MKLLLVGDERQGKTSLLHYLQTGKSFKDTNKKEPERTDGVDIKIWREKKEKKEVTISSWDFAGQRVSLMSSFLFSDNILQGLLCNTFSFPFSRINLSCCLGHVFSS